MAREISIPLPDKSIVKFDWEGEGEPSDEIKNQVLEQVGTTKFGGSIPKPPPPPPWVAPVQTSAELIGLLGGAAPGIATANPIAAAGGAGLGYTGMKGASDYFLERMGVKKPLGILERIKQMGIDLPTGMATEMAGQAIGPAISSVGKAFSYPWGAYTGAGSTSIKEAYRGAPDFAKFMRGQGEQSALVREGKSGIGKLVEDRQSVYTDFLSRIKGKSALDPNFIEDALNTTLKEYDIRFFPGRAVNWRNTKFVTNPTAQQEMEGAIKTVREWGDYSPLGVDNLKQALDNLYKRSQPEASSFVRSLRNKIKDILVNNIPEYKQMVNQYKTSSEEIMEISKDLSLGDLNTKKQALQKLLSAMKRDDQFTLDLISKIDRSGGLDFRAALAGTQMQSYIPTSLVGKMGGMYELFRGVTNLSWPDILGVMASSPRLVGEFLNALGKVAKPGIKGLKYAPPTTQALIQEEQGQ